MQPKTGETISKDDLAKVLRKAKSEVKRLKRSFKNDQKIVAILPAISVQDGKVRPLIKIVVENPQYIPNLKCQPDVIYKRFVKKNQKAT